MNGLALNTVSQLATVLLAWPFLLLGLCWRPRHLFGTRARRHVGWIVRVRRGFSSVCGGNYGTIGTNRTGQCLSPDA